MFRLPRLDPNVTIAFNQSVEFEYMKFRSTLQMKVNETVKNYSFVECKNIQKLIGQVVLNNSFYWMCPDADFINQQNSSDFNIMLKVNRTIVTNPAVGDVHAQVLKKKPIVADLFAIQSQLYMPGNSSKTGIYRVTKILEPDFLKDRGETRITLRLNHYKPQELSNKVLPFSYLSVSQMLPFALPTDQDQAVFKF